LEPYSKKKKKILKKIITINFIHLTKLMHKFIKNPYWKLQCIKKMHKKFLKTFALMTLVLTNLLCVHPGHCGQVINWLEERAEEFDWNLLNMGLTPEELGVKMTLPKMKMVDPLDIAPGWETQYKHFMSQSGIVVPNPPPFFSGSDIP
jgi:hypothetical protein